MILCSLKMIKFFRALWIVFTFIFIVYNVTNLVDRRYAVQTKINVHDPKTFPYPDISACYDLIELHTLSSFLPNATEYCTLGSLNYEMCEQWLLKHPLDQLVTKFGMKGPFFFAPQVAIGNTKLNHSQIYFFKANICFHFPVEQLLNKVSASRTKNGQRMLLTVENVYVGKLADFRSKYLLHWWPNMPDIDDRFQFSPVIFVQELEFIYFHVQSKHLKAPYESNCVEHFLPDLLFELSTSSKTSAECMQLCLRQFGHSLYNVYIGKVQKMNFKLSSLRTPPPDQWQTCSQQCDGKSCLDNSFDMLNKRRYVSPLFNPRNQNDDLKIDVFRPEYPILQIETMPIIPFNVLLIYLCSLLNSCIGIYFMQLIQPIKLLAPKLDQFNMKRSSFKTIRLVWLLIAFTCCSIQIGKISSEYLQYETYTETRLQPISEMNLFSYSLCFDICENNERIPKYDFCEEDEWRMWFRNETPQLSDLLSQLNVASPCGLMLSISSNEMRLVDNYADEFYAYENKCFRLNLPELLSSKDLKSNCSQQNSKYSVQQTQRYRNLLLHAHFNENFPPQTYAIHKANTFPYKELGTYSSMRDTQLGLNIVKVKRLQPPYDTNCRTYEKTRSQLFHECLLKQQVQKWAKQNESKRMKSLEIRDLQLVTRNQLQNVGLDGKQKFIKNFDFPIEPTLLDLCDSEMEQPPCEEEILTTFELMPEKWITTKQIQRLLMNGNMLQVEHCAKWQFIDLVLYLSGIMAMWLNVTVFDALDLLHNTQTIKCCKKFKYCNQTLSFWLCMRLVWKIGCLICLVVHFSLITSRFLNSGLISNAVIKSPNAIKPIVFTICAYQHTVDRQSYLHPRHCVNHKVDPTTPMTKIFAKANCRKKGLNSNCKSDQQFKLNQTFNPDPIDTSFDWTHEIELHVLNNKTLMYEMVPRNLINYFRLLKNLCVQLRIPYTYEMHRFKQFSSTYAYVNLPKRSVQFSVHDEHEPVTQDLFPYCSEQTEPLTIRVRWFHLYTERKDSFFSQQCEPHSEMIQRRKQIQKCYKQLFHKTHGQWPSSSKLPISMNISEIASLHQEYSAVEDLPNEQLYQQCLQKYAIGLLPCEMHTPLSLITNDESSLEKSIPRQMYLQVPNLEFVISLSARLQTSEYLVYIGNLIGFWLGLALFVYMDAIIQTGAWTWKYSVKKIVDVQRIAFSLHK